MLPAPPLPSLGAPCGSEFSGGEVVDKDEQRQKGGAEKLREKKKLEIDAANSHIHWQSGVRAAAALSTVPATTINQPSQSQEVPENG